MSFDTPNHSPKENIPLFKKLTELPLNSRAFVGIGYLDNRTERDETLMFPWNMFPFNENMKKMMSQMKPGEIEKYTQDIIGNIIPKHMNGMMNNPDMLKGIFPDLSNQNSATNHFSLKYSVFETHEYVFVRLKIETEDWLKQMKLYHTANLMMIEQIPSLDDKHTLTLPAMVKKRGAKAAYQDGTLEIKLPKSSDVPFSEIDVTEIY